MIPYKLWMRLTDLLTDHLAERTKQTDDALFAMEQRVNWPWNASNEQVEEWNKICQRLRVAPTIGES